MGKKAQGGGGGGGGKKGQGGKYIHKHTYNPKARESEERKLEALKNIEIKRHQKHVDTNMALLTNYLTPEARAKKPKPDPSYHLKGAARVAQEFYRPPGYKEEEEPVDLIEQFKGRLWDCHADEAQTLLHAMNDLSVALHNTKGKTKAAIGVLEHMLVLDTADHLFARHRLLRCYLDLGEAGHARALLDKYEQDRHCAMVYSRALIECIALMLEEEDASSDAVDVALGKAYEINPYALWTIVHHEAFREALEEEGNVEVLQQINDEICTPGSIIDAVRFADVDLPIWIETEGAVEHVEGFIRRRKLHPPTIQDIQMTMDALESDQNKPDAGDSAKGGGDDDEEEDGDEEEDDDSISALVDIYMTGLSHIVN